MAPGNKRAKNRVSGSGARRQVAQASAPSSGDSTADSADEASSNDADSNEDTAPLNRAERRLEAKRKRGRSTSAQPTPRGSNAATGSMRGRGYQGGPANVKGTNTRRSG